MKAHSQSRRDFIRTSALAAGSLPFIGSMISNARAAEGERKLKWCVVGLGGLSSGQIGPAFAKTKYCEISAVVSGHLATKGPTWKQRYNIADKNMYDYGTMEKMVDNPDIDVVYVVTPNALHAEHAIKALKAGKHVFCEKPMETSPEKCQQMIDAAKKADRMLGVAYRCQFDPNHQQCFKLAKDKTYGPIKALEAGFGRTMSSANTPGNLEWRLQKALAGGGPLMDVGIYALQSIRCLTGLEPIEVSAKFHPITLADRFAEVEEGLDWETTFPGGLVAKSSTSYNDGGKNGFSVTAEKATFGLRPAYGYTGCVGTIVEAGGATKAIERLPNTFSEFAAEMDDFAQCIMNKKPTQVPGEEGLRDVRIMMAIYESAKTGKPVKLA